MKYFIDTEFIEGFHITGSLVYKLFGKRRHHIDLISIAIVAEDGRSFYAISKEYDYNDADAWVKKNVIMPMYIQTVHGDQRNRYDASNFHKFYGLENKQIAEGIQKFIQQEEISKFDVNTPEQFGKIEFYGYYADYDWVLFCSLFGRMIDLPKGFPMYCRDLKQMFDEKQFGWGEDNLKEHPDYPKQENEHNALADAKWNKKLFDFINSL